jgi:2-hydroxychromene-2-carboxylate isomerase
MAAPIDFWFSIGSTYTYLTVMRIDEVARQSGVAFSWRPFNVRAIMLEMNNIPFSTKPIKARYMWRDIERRAAMYGLVWSAIPPYPLKDLPLPNRIALIGAREGWCAAYVTATYRRWFADGQDASSEPNISASLRDIGQEPVRVLTLAASEDVKNELLAATDTARDLGIFGAPTFAVGDELFWGDDRLCDAIAWHRHSALQRSA